VNQYQATNLGFRSQLCNRRDMAVTSSPGAFLIIVSEAALMQKNIYTTDLFHIAGTRFTVCVGDIC
jgi:hypothetical protein